MSKIKFLGIFTILLFMVSCSKDEKLPVKDISENKNEIVGKWELDFSKYKSIEFTKQGYYIIVKNNVTRRSVQENDFVIYGKYTITDDKVITIEGIGIISDFEIKLNKISFILNSKPYTGIKKELIASSNKTTKLCKKWVLVKITEQGKETRSAYYGSTIFFTQSGTYLMNNKVRGFTNLNKWNWDKNEKNIQYIREDQLNTGGGGTLVLNSLTENELIATETSGKTSFTYFFRS